MRKKSTIFLLILTLVLSMGLTGCKSKEDAPVDKDIGDEAVDTPDDSTTDYVGGDRGNVLTIGGTSPNGTFNPITHSVVYDRYIIDLMFETLLNIEPDGTLITEGSLTDSYEVSEDGLTYTFKMKEGINWHDGKPVTAHDAVWTFNAIFDPGYKGNHYSAVFQDIVGAKEVKAGEAEAAEGVKALDDYTLEVTVHDAKATTLRQIASEWIMPAHYYGDKNADEMAALDRDPMGNGPFRLKKYEVEQYIEMAPNADYWQGTPKLDGIVYKVIANEDELVEFEIGNIDAVNFEGSIENYETIEEYDHGTLINNMNNSYEYAAFNFTNPILADKNVRQALNYGLDRQGFVDSFFGDMGGFVAHTPMSPVSWAYPGESKLKDYAFNQEKAIQLLEESGWMEGSDGIREKNGEKLSFTWSSYQEAAWSTKITAFAAEQWKQIGVDCTIELMDLNSLSDLTSDPGNVEEWDMFNMAWELVVDPDIYSTFSKNQFPPGNNKGYFENEEIEKLMLDGLNELDQEKRKEIYQELAVLFNEELPYIYLYMRMDPWLVNTRVKNFTPSEFLRWTHNAHEIEITQ